MMRKLCSTSLLCVALLGTGMQAPAHAGLPHGCASVSSDYSAATDPSARRFAVKVNTDEPCTFIYAEGDTFSGSGRFTVTCSSGGYYHHPDFQEGKYPPVFNVPVPQPCAVGATVTLNGYHVFTGGMVVGGGFGSGPDLPKPRFPQPDFRELCAPGTEAFASVDLREPVNYSGLLTSVGTVRCQDADVRITSLTVTPLAGFSYPSAGTARCKRCRDPISVSGTVPATAWAYDVELTFEVARGSTTVSGTRLGRYAVTWAGNVTTLCPGLRAGPLPDNQTYVTVPGGETCPA